MACGENSIFVETGAQQEEKSAITSRKQASEQEKTEKAAPAAEKPARKHGNNGVTA
jgi:hypothetical protein